MIIIDNIQCANTHLTVAYHINMIKSKSDKKCHEIFFSTREHLGFNFIAIDRLHNGQVDEDVCQLQH